MGVRSPKLSVRVIGPAALCLGLAAIPALAWACDMQAVNDELAREAKAEALTPQVQAAADPSGATAADPSGDPSGSAKQQPEGAKTEPSASSSSSGSSQSQPAEPASKSAAPMGHSAGGQQENKR